MITHQQTTLDQMSSAVPFLPRENCDRLDSTEAPSCRRAVELFLSSATEGLLVRARKAPPLRDNPCTIHVFATIFFIGLGLGLGWNEVFLYKSKNIEQFNTLLVFHSL